MRPSAIAGFLVTLVLTGGSAAAAVVDPDIRVIVRTYDAPHPAALDSAMAVTAAILTDAGISVTWMSCHAVFVGDTANRCLSPLAPDEVSIRFVRLPPHLAEQRFTALGDSLVDIRRRTGSLATIYVNRVEGLAMRCGVDAGVLLGRAMAHEIGHLLLGTPEHAGSGLMRAEWSQKTLRSERPGDWTFNRGDARSMREAVRVRSAQRVAIARIGQ